MILKRGSFYSCITFDHALTESGGFMVVVKVKQAAKRFWQRFWHAGEGPEPLVEVVRAAAMDEQIKDSLFMILRMERKQRKSAVQSLVVRLQVQQAPAGLVAALSSLEDDAFADATLKVLEETI